MSHAAASAPTRHGASCIGCHDATAPLSSAAANCPAVDFPRLVAWPPHYHRRHQRPAWRNSCQSRRIAAPQLRHTAIARAACGITLQRYFRTHAQGCGCRTSRHHQPRPSRRRRGDRSCSRGGGQLEVAPDVSARQLGQARQLNGGAVPWDRLAPAMGAGTPRLRVRGLHGPA